MSNGDTRKTWIQKRIDKGLCVECGNPVTPETFKRCINCRERQNISAKKYRQGVGKELHREAASRWQKSHPERIRELSRQNYKKVKDIIFEHYGLVCVCCGETTYEFLTIDHIDGNGNEHRRQIKRYSLYHWLRKKQFP